MSKVAVANESSKDISVKEDIVLPSNERREGAIGIFSRLLRLDSLSGKRCNSLETPTPSDTTTVYYGVYIPCEIKKGPDEDALHVYKNKSDALELVKRYKAARFKAFQNRQDALAFALRGADIPDSCEGNEGSLMGEKPYPFKAPSPQDMVALRKAIEAGLTVTVHNRVWDNPRYLVSSGNTPAILQEGSRYNALHVSAKTMKAEICNLILTTVGNPEFIQTLYGGDADAECCKEFAGILLDRYLNTPDKAMNETPLHFASKFGAVEVVDVLTSFPQCNKNAVNKFGEEPKDIICKRTSIATTETAQRIARMLQPRFYVPVLHSEDESFAPSIGRPFTPAQPPDLNADPMSPRCEIRAFAGPMDSNDAEMFRRRWKTPPRVQHPNQLTPTAFRLKELTKGFEAVGRNLAEEMQVGWKEYWAFLGTFTDLRSPEGLVLLENYLKSKYENACSFAYNESVAQGSLEDIVLSEMSIRNSFESSTSELLSPMSELCVAMRSCTISSDRPTHWRKTDPLRQRLCRQPNAKIQNQNGEIQPPNHTVSQLLCIERTCQVFAKRIADALIFSLTSEPEVAGESLKSEAKHLQHTVFTYMDDERFHNIDFALIHSRLAQLVVFKLKQQTTDLDDINHLVEFLIKLRCPNDDIFSSDDERKPIYRPSNKVSVNHVIDMYVRCLASFISEELSENEEIKGPSMTDTDCNEIWGRASKCRCEWKLANFERNSKKNASFRKNRSLLSTSPNSESVLKRLVFDQNSGDGHLHPSEEEEPLNINSPAGDGAVTIYTVNTDKCQIIDSELISDDDSVLSDNSDEFYTALEYSDSETEMFDASDRAIADAFIYGEEPCKMDRLVFDAVADCKITPDEYPNIYRWRHTIALYSPDERNKWQSIPTSEDVVDSVTYSFNLGQPLDSGCQRVKHRKSLRVCPGSSPASLDRTSTPKKGDCSFGNDSSSHSISLQVSNWLRITGPNTPRAALASKNVEHNVSFGF